MKTTCVKTALATATVCLIVGTIIVAAFGASPAVAQSYHHPVYVVGGDLPTGSTTLTQGIQMLDLAGAAPQLTKLLQPGFTSRFTMDRDNRHILIAVQGTSSSNTLYNGPRGGLYRYDPVTNTVVTVNAPPWSPVIGYHSFYHLDIDHNGDYICGVYNFDRLTPTNSGYRLIKVSPSGRATTMVFPWSLGRKIELFGKITRNIRSGHTLVCDMFVQTSPTTIRYPILEVDTASGFTFTFSTGGAYGWYGFYGAPQNYRTGDIEGPYGTRVFRVTPGTSSRTTVTVLPGIPYPIYGGGAFDLQTAASPRVLSVGYTNTPGQTFLYTLDATNWAVTSVRASATAKTQSNAFAFYRGRHTQSILSARLTWDIHLSAPQHPNKAYAIAIGASGVSPGVKLPDGRRILLNLDNAVLLSSQNRLQPFFSPGPGYLDKNGEAKARISTALLGTVNIPIWVSWVVIDPAAPFGIAYMPDPYVLRI